MKKHISLLLALCMLFTMLPMGMTVVSATTTTVTQSAADAKTATADVIDISTLQSEITLTFTPAVANTSGITFKKVSGDDLVDIKGAIKTSSATAEDNSTSTYTIEFGRLEDNTQYKLTVPASVTSNGADTVFTYLATENGYVLNTDMSDISKDEETGLLNDTRFTYLGGAENFTIQRDGEGETANSYMVINQADTAQTALKTAFAQTIYLQIAPGNFNNLLAAERDVYVIETALKSYGKSGTETSVSNTSKDLLATKGMGAGSGKSPFTWANGANKLPTVTNVESADDKNVTVAAGENGWSHVQVVMKEDGRRSAANTTVTVGGSTTLVSVDPYDNTPGNKKMLGVGNNNTWSVNGNKVNIAGFWIYSKKTGTQEIDNGDGTTSTVDVYTVLDNSNNYIAIDYVRAKKDKAMTVLKTDGYTKADKKVVFHMSDDIDATSLNTITVKNGETAVTNFEASVDDDARTITLQFDDAGLGAEGEDTSYTVDLSRVLGTNGVAVYNEDYEVENGAFVNKKRANVPFTVSAAEAGGVTKINESSIESGATGVSVHVGELTLAYTEALDDDTLDGISIVSVGENGAETAIKGKVFRDLSDDGKTVTLTFGRLGAGEHKIKVTGVKTLAGEDAKTEEIAFTTVEARVVDVNTEFNEDKYVIGQVAPEEYTSSNKKAIHYMIAASSANDRRTTGTEVISDGSDDKAIALKLTYDESAGTYKDGVMGVNTSQFNTTLLNEERDVYVIDTAIKTYTVDDAAESAAGKQVLKFSRTNEGNNYLGKFNSGDLKAQNLKNTANNGIELGAGSEWKKLRAVVRLTGTYGWYSTTPLIPKAENEKLTTPYESANYGVTAHENIDLYDVTGDIPRYLGEENKAALNNTSIDIARISADNSGAKDRIAVDYVYARKDKAMTVIKADTAYTKDNKKLVFYMTDDIDAASKDNVVVKSGDTVINDRIVTVNAADRSLTIEFAGLTAGNYTVDLGGVIGTNGVAVYNGKYYWDSTIATTNKDGYKHENLATYSFTVLPADGAFVVTGAISNGVALGNTLDADAGEITVEFPAALAPGAEDYITLTKEGGRIGGKVIKTVDDTNVTLKFGRLDAGAEYTLTIPATVTNEAGAAVTPKTYTFTATREYLINAQDQFANITSGTVLHEGANAWEAKSGDKFDAGIRSATFANTQLSNDDFRITLDGDVTMKTTEGGEKYLEMKPATDHTANSLTVGAFITPLSNGTATTFISKFIKTNPGKVFAMDVSMNTKAVDEEKQVGHNASLLAIYHRHLVQYKGSDVMGKLAQYAGTASVGGLTKSDGYTFDTTLADGEFGTTRLVTSSTLGANATLDTNSYKVYDLDKQQYIGYNFAPAKVTWDALARLAVQAIDTEGVPGSDNVMVNLKDYKAFLAEPMDVLDTQFDGNELKLTIWMTDAIDASTAGKVVITPTGDGAEALDPSTYEVVCNDTERSIEITFPWGLPTAAYNVSLANVEPKNGLADGTAATSFEVEEGSAVCMTNVAFKGSVDGGDLLPLVSSDAVEGESIEIGAVDTIQATAEISGIDTAVVFLAIYDGEYNLLKVVPATENENIYTATVNGLPKDTVKHAKLYVWRSLETLEPLFKPLQRL